MSRQAIIKQYQQVLTKWPVDRLRPEPQTFQHLLKSRIEQAAPTTIQADETLELRAASALLHNNFKSRFPTSKQFMTPASNPNHYSNLAKELEELPDRTWFSSIIKRLQRTIRLK